MIPYSDIERVARRMCVLMGVGPDDQISGSYWHTLTAYERMQHPYGYAQYPVSLPAWRWMVQHAERAVAGHAAVQEIVNEAWRSKKDDPA